MSAKSKRAHKSGSTRKSSSPQPAASAGSPKQSSKINATRARAARLSSRRRTNTLGLLLLLVAIIAVAGIYFGTRPSTVEAVAPAEITTAQAYEKYQAGVLLLDVREQDEWDAGHIPNTTHIPLGELSSRVDELPKDQEIVVVCRSGNRSAEGRDILLQNGFTNVTSMAGGVSDWSSAGYPFGEVTP